jgi:phosphopantetheine--protein transferase-like protein
MAGCEVGVDVEQIRPLPDVHEIASRFFCPEEAAELISLPPDQRGQAFFLCWTRKEAYIKAIGDGLSAPLHGFRVTLRRSQANLHVCSISQRMRMRPGIGRCTIFPSVLNTRPRSPTAPNHVPLKCGRWPIPQNCLTSPD